MKSTKIKIKNLLLLLAVFAIGLASASQVMAQVSGAIFTSLVDGTTVNANHYDFKSEVYLNGGPQNTNSAGLTPGIYYFQITTPGWHPMSGENGLLSTDNAECRLLVVNNDGRISGNNGGNCPHANGTLNTTNGSTPVQMIPFADTTNPGGEYKAWIIRQDQASVVNDSNGNPRVLYFSERDSKTDNFKVRERRECVGETCEQPPPPAVISGIKFYDYNMNGIRNPSLEPGIAGEPVISGWHIELYKGIVKVNETDTDANGAYLFEVAYVAGDVYTVKEIMQADWQAMTVTEHTVILGSDANGPVYSYPNNDFGNIHLSKIGGIKYYDADLSGTFTDGDTGLPGIKITVTATKPNGAPDGEMIATGANGVWTSKLYPDGTSYAVTETLPLGNWTQVRSRNLSGIVNGNNDSADFLNVCSLTPGGRTLGFWSNRNGLALVIAADFTRLTGYNLRNANGSPKDFTASLSSNKTALNSWLIPLRRRIWHTCFRHKLRRRI
jgi:hypothetical protein